MKLRHLTWVLLVACDAGKKPAPPPPPAPPPAVVVPDDAALSIDATSDATTDAPISIAPSAPAVKPPRNNGFVDTPAWPPQDNSVVLGWIVSPATVPAKRDPDLLLAPLTLEASMSAVTRRIELEPQFGGLSAPNQAFCGSAAYPLGKRDVAILAFYEGGAGGYLVRRGPADVLQVIAWEQGDGACPDARGEPSSCDRRERPVFRMHVPPTAKVYYTITELDAQGRRTTFDCTR